jgi:hypothetical protein
VLDLLNALDSPEATTVIAPPGAGQGYWAGGPSAVCGEGVIWLAYRLRRPVHLGRGYANVVARSIDGLTFETVATVTSAQFDCASLERPALVRRPDGGWRLYVSCSTPASKHWWLEAVDADIPEGLASGARARVLPGDDSEAWKDVVVRAGDDGWQMWACRHPLDGGDDEADRMSTWYATSPDGLSWAMRAEALSPSAAQYAIPSGGSERRPSRRCGSRAAAARRSVRGSARTAPSRQPRAGVRRGRPAGNRVQVPARRPTGASSSRMRDRSGRG